MKEYDSRILSCVTTFNCCPRGALPCDLLQPIVHVNKRHTNHTCKPRVSNRDSSMNFRRRGSMSMIPQIWFMYFSMFVGVNLCFYMKRSVAISDFLFIFSLFYGSSSLSIFVHAPRPSFHSFISFFLLTFWIRFFRSLFPL